MTNDELINSYKQADIARQMIRATYEEAGYHESVADEYIKDIVDYEINQFTQDLIDWKKSKLAQEAKRKSMEAYANSK